MIRSVLGAPSSPTLPSDTARVASTDPNKALGEYSNQLLLVHLPCDINMNEMIVRVIGLNECRISIANEEEYLD